MAAGSAAVWPRWMAGGSSAANWSPTPTRAGPSGASVRAGVPSGPAPVAALARRVARRRWASAACPASRWGGWRRGCDRRLTGQIDGPARCGPAASTRRTVGSRAAEALERRGPCGRASTTPAITARSNAAPIAVRRRRRAAAGPASGWGRAAASARRSSPWRAWRRAWPRQPSASRRQRPVWRRVALGRRRALRFSSAAARSRASRLAFSALRSFSAATRAAASSARRFLSSAALAAASSAWRFLSSAALAAASSAWRFLSSAALAAAASARRFSSSATRAAASSSWRLSASAARAAASAARRRFLLSGPRSGRFLLAPPHLGLPLFLCRQRCRAASLDQLRHAASRTAGSMTRAWRTASTASSKRDSSIAWRAKSSHPASHRSRSARSSSTRWRSSLNPFGLAAQFLEGALVTRACCRRTRPTCPERRDSRRPGTGRALKTTASAARSCSSARRSASSASAACRSMTERRRPGRIDGERRVRTLHRPG